MSDAEREEIVTCEHARMIALAALHQKKSCAALAAGCYFLEQHRSKILESGRNQMPKSEQDLIVASVRKNANLTGEANIQAKKSEAVFLALVSVSENQRIRLRDAEKKKSKAVKSSRTTLRHWITQQKRKFSDFPCSTKYL